MPEEQLEFNLERPTANDLATEVVRAISDETIQKKTQIDIGRIQEIIREVFAKNKLDPLDNNIDSNLYYKVHELVMPNKYKKSATESVLYRKSNRKPISTSDAVDIAQREKEESEE